MIVPDEVADREEVDYSIDIAVLPKCLQAASSVPQVQHQGEDVLKELLDSALLKWVPDATSIRVSLASLAQA